MTGINYRENIQTNTSMEFQTNTTVTETHVQVNLRWDPGYVKTLPGAIKSVVIVSMKSHEVFT